MKECVFVCHGRVFVIHCFYLNLASMPMLVSNGRKLPVILTHSAKPEANIPKLSSWLAGSILELINSNIYLKCNLYS